MINPAKITTVLGQILDEKRTKESTIVQRMMAKRGILGSMIRTEIKDGEVPEKTDITVDVTGTESSLFEFLFVVYIENNI